MVETVPFTKIQLETIEVVRKTDTYEEADKRLKLKKGTINSRMQTIREKIKRAQLIVNIANNWKKDPKLRKKLLSRVVSDG